MRTQRQLPVLTSGYGAEQNTAIMHDGILMARLIVEGYINYNQLIVCLRDGTALLLTRENTLVLEANGLLGGHSGFCLYQVIKRSWCVLQGYAVEGGNPTPSLEMLAAQLHTVDMDTLKAWWENVPNLPKIKDKS